LPPSQISHLVDATGNFPDSPLQIGWHYQFNRAARQELMLEIRAQLEKFCATGLPLSHVDGHLHMHVHPVVLRALVELADEFKIKAIRLPSEELRLTLGLDKSDLMTKLIWSFVFTRLHHHGERLLKLKGIGFVERVYGLLATGHMTEAYLLGLIPQIRANLVEIYSHPAIATAVEPTNGPLGNGQAELDALISERVCAELIAKGFELTNYNNQEAL
ncbi:MAG: ChbG/HpnK family deacetylase, partial [Chroococcidiopsidaceae cyanobacterium CP_BM_RX_35]|nr:ChbG/HpnK family deacetylase [Chroococcidiopsidaceae cyanobacterium CP_BM_RX_35]